MRQCLYNNIHATRKDTNVTVDGVDLTIDNIDVTIAIQRYPCDGEQ